MSDYNCRQCPIRARCIEQSATPARIKEMMRNAFAARTDTVSMWASLQKSCLLVKEEEEQKRRAAEGSLLSQRLRQAKQEEVEETAQEEAVEEPVEQDFQPGHGESAPFTEQSFQSAYIGSDEFVETPPKISSKRTGPDRMATITIDRSDLPTDVPEIPDDEEVSRFDRPFSTPSSDFWLVVFSSKRRILLPNDGRLILGRFDPDTDSPLDVDFSFEDQDKRTISRRHAEIIAEHGAHLIQDLGSRNGVFINGRRLTSNRPYRLRPRSRIELGKVAIGYC